MIIIGLTGNIASGKSTVAAMFRYHRIPTFNADSAAHHLLQNDADTINTIADFFPQCLENGKISRTKLGNEVFADPRKRKQLEGILHPKIRQKERMFIRKHQQLKQRMIVLDIPLLFETHADERVDSAMLCKTPLFLVRQRALKRPHMTKAKLTHILNQQMPLHEKLKKADIIIHTGAGKGETMRQVKYFIHSFQLSTPQKNT